MIKEDVLLKGNKLLMKYMGIKPRKTYDGNRYQWSDSPFFHVVEDKEEQVIESIAKYVKYHSSWDWLMAVKDEIEASDGNSEEKWMVTIGEGNFCRIRNVNCEGTFEEEFIGFDGETPIETAWLVFVAFLEDKENEEVMDGNKLIAEFRGFKFNKFKKAFVIPPLGFSFKGKIKDLKFHSSFDWLMPVVKEIQNMEEYGEWVILTFNHFDDAAELDITILWRKVVEFVKWYNENKPKE